MVVIVLATTPLFQETGAAYAQAVPRPTLIRGPAVPTDRVSIWDCARSASLVSSRSVSDSEEESGTAHRIPLLAGVLGILPGLGHVYAGEPGRGLIVAGVWLGSGMVAFSSANKVVTGAGGVVLIGASVYGIADAALAAERFNRRHARPATKATFVPTSREQ
jgi:hypothetical protein